jgi:hypothetical protein
VRPAAWALEFNRGSVFTWIKGLQHSGFLQFVNSFVRVVKAVKVVNRLLTGFDMD